MTIILYSRLLTRIFSIFLIVITFYRYFPEEKEGIPVFMFLFFWNFGVQCACYQLMKFCAGWQERAMLAVQIGFAGWSIYSLRFVFDTVRDPQKLQAFFYVPLWQYGILLAILILLFFLNRDRAMRD